MKKTTLLFITLMVLAASCRKDQDSGLPVEQSVIDGARQFFDQAGFSANPQQGQDYASPRARIPKIPVWEKAKTIELSSGMAVIVPLHYANKIYTSSNLDKKAVYDLDDIAQLLIYKGPGKDYHAEIVVTSPDSSFVDQSSFSGIVTVEDWNGQLIRMYKKSGQVVLTLAENASKQPSTYMTVVATCYDRVTYVYSVDDPLGGVYSYEDLGCDVSYISGSSGSAGAGPTGADYTKAGAGGTVPGASSASTMVVNKGNAPIANIKDYIKCFQNKTGATYSVSLEVDQPSNGSRKSYSSAGRGDGASGLNVGHVFLVFEQNVSGVITRRSIGLYPSGTVTPLTPASPGSLNDDEGHYYDVSLNITMTGLQFMDVLNACAAGNGVSYNLNTNNCTTWALNSLAAGNVVVHTKPGTWPFGGGDDPGDLGEDLRALTTSVGWSVSKTGGYGPANIGVCP